MLGGVKRRPTTSEEGPPAGAAADGEHTDAPMDESEGTSLLGAATAKKKVARRGDWGKDPIDKTWLDKAITYAIERLKDWWSRREKGTTERKASK